MDARYADVEMYVNVNQEECSAEKFAWKSKNCVNNMTIYPDDRPYKLGTYRVFVKRKNSNDNLISRTEEVGPFRIWLQTNTLDSIRDIGDEK